MKRLAQCHWTVASQIIDQKFIRLLDHVLLLDLPIRLDEVSGDKNFALDGISADNGGIVFNYPARA